MIDTNTIRNDFPILKKQINGYSLAYLDNAATSQKPSQVIEAISNYYKHHNANVNRGVHQLAEESTEAYAQSRKTVADFIGASETETIFVRNTTEAINLVAYGWGLKNLKPGDEIILTDMEHHSNLVPWQMIAQKTGAVLRFWEVKENGELNLSELKSLLSDKTKLISLVHVSNTLGTINPVEEIFKRVKKYNQEIICIVDGAQSTPHMLIDVHNLKTDFFAFSGHKMLGPMGIGVLWGRKEILESMDPFLGGGDMISEVYLDHATYNQVPEKFEAGTPNVADAVGLAEAVRYLQQVGLEHIHNHEKELIAYTLEKLADFKEITILGTKNKEKRGAVVAFDFKGVHAHDVAQILNSVGVAVRSGHHCTMPLHKKLHITASTRISPYLYNTKEEIDRVIEGLHKVKKVFSV